jgi:cell division protein ZipA
MPELRWILIGFGIVLLAGIYLWGRRGSAVADDSTLRTRPEAELQPRRDVAEPVATDPPAFDTTSATDSGYEEPVFAPTMIRPANRALSRPVPREALADEPLSPPPAGDAVPRDTWRGRVEPSLGDHYTRAMSEAHDATVELPVNPPEDEPAVETPPTLSTSDAPTPRRIERRKILSLRLASGVTKFDGARLLETLRTESLEHGRYDVFHRLHTDGVSIFSIASMVEPGTFDVERMPEIQYPGITLFAQLPGPVPGMHALNELVACARRLQQTLGGTLQDDRGVPLTVHRIERLRQEVREFERPSSGGGRSGPIVHSPSQ